MNSLSSFFKSLITIILVFVACSVFALSMQANEYLKKAKNYLNTGNYKAAEDFYNRAKSLESDDPEIKQFGELLNKKIEEHVQKLSQKAFVYMQEKNLPKASIYYKEILMFRPNDSEALLQLDEIKRINEEIKEYKKQGIAVDVSSGRGYDLNKYSAISSYNSAYALFKKGEYKKALDILNMILEKEPDYGSAQKLKEEVESVYELKQMIDKAESSFKSQSMDSVIKAVSELLSKAPDQVQYYLMRAKAYYLTKRYNNAYKDLLTYYSYTQDKKVAFPLMADTCSKSKKNLYALGYAYDKTSKSYNKPFSFIIKNYFFGYYWENIILIILLFIVLPVTLFYTKQTVESLFGNYSLRNIFKTIKCLFYAITDKNEKCLKELLELSREINNPWMNYYTGLVLLENNDLIKAQRFFKFSMGKKAYKARASYFHGITSKLLKEKAYEGDFEESVLSSLDNEPINIWRPWFLKKIEERLINRFSVKDDDSLESMSYKLLNSII